MKLRQNGVVSCMVKLAGQGQKIIYYSFRGILNLESRILNPGAAGGAVPVRQQKSNSGASYASGKKKQPDSCAGLKPVPIACYRGRGLNLSVFFAKTRVFAKIATAIL
jgi:hypothetical protein